MVSRNYCKQTKFPHIRVDCHLSDKSRQAAVGHESWAAAAPQVIQQLRLVVQLHSVCVVVVGHNFYHNMVELTL